MQKVKIIISSWLALESSNFWSWPGQESYTFIFFLRLFTVRYKLNRKSSNVSMQAVKRKNKNLNNARTHLIWWHINDYAHPYLRPLAMHVVLVYFVFLWTPGFLGSASKLNVVFEDTCKITGITEEITTTSVNFGNIFCNDRYLTAYTPK